jgi:4-hydroxy-2-oxoheptanedioate aldolase
MLDAPTATERLAMLGYDFVCLDAQHGLIGYSGLLSGLMAIEAGGRSVGLVRVGANDPFLIGQALDAGAAGVIVPLVNTADDARRALAAARYPAYGVRSYAPMRAGLRIGPVPAEADWSVVVLAMIETRDGLANVEEICQVQGLDGIYVGPYDLRLALGGAHPTDPAFDEAFDEAVERISRAAERAGVCAGFHTFDGADAAVRLRQGFTLATVCCDLTHLEQVAADHLRRARDLG